MMTNQIGRLAGRQKASNIPVTIADPSEMAGFSFNKNRWINHSNTTQETIAVRVIITDPIPKKYTETRKAGNNAMITPYISFETDSLLWSCGDGDMVNMPID
jgi:hypothetical protein